jgi:hypothetical protein
MSNWAKSVNYGGIYARSLHQNYCQNCDIKNICHYRQLIAQLQKWSDIVKDGWKQTKKALLFITKNLKKHISQKQEFYWPVLIAITLLLFVFASKIAFAEVGGAPNNLPIDSNSKLNIIGFQKKTVQPNVIAFEKKDNENKSEKDALKSEIADIVKNTPMVAMTDSISEKNRTVAAFLVGIAMKESKFGIYSPKIAGRDCYNYWGFKGGGKTVVGGYTCFASPEDAVDAVAKRIEKMVAKGVKSPAQAISWKCGSSCAGHDPGGVHKWIADVAINFNKINS